jgi:hypothetical protein
MNDFFFDQFLKSKGLWEMWQHIVTTNKGVKNTYHNTLHMYYAAQLGLQILRATPEYQKLDSSDKHNEELIVVVSLLWHDYNHSGGSSSDAENIQFAIAGYTHWRKHVRPIPANFNPVMEHEQEHFMIQSVSQTIEITEFPFIREPITLAQKVVRDADLLYTFCDETGDVVYGLYKELVPKLPKNMTFVGFLDGQVKFHNEVVLFTEPAKELHAQMKLAVIQEQYNWVERFPSQA